MTDPSSKIKNYSIIGACIVISATVIIGGIPFIQLQFVQFDTYQKTLEQIQKNNSTESLEPKLSMDADCFPSQSIVGIENYGKVSVTNVTCTAIKSGIFIESEIFLGDIPPGSRDGCVFESIKPLEKMTRFEIKYNEDQTRKFLCHYEDHD